MFRSGSIGSRAKTIVLGAALLGCPCGVFAQHGAGGGGVGGGQAGSGGLSGGNHATGVAAKDDLKSFHEVLAVQASREQVIAYAAMLESTAAAAAELKALEEQVGKETTAPGLAGRNKMLADKIESARILNKKFLEGFSEPQKTGLKEITKRLGKADSELAQQAKIVDQALAINATNSPMASSVQNLEHVLTIFQRAQAELGEEMSILTTNSGQNLVFNLAPVKTSVNFANQTIAVTTSGVVSKGPSEGGQSTFAVVLTADLSDLQQSIPDVLRVRLNKADRCGERIALRTAELTPQGLSGLVVVQLHYERWTCAAMFGRDSMNEMVEGNGTIEIRLVPAVAEDGTLRLVAQIGRVDAEGLIGESMRSGSLGETIRDKIAESILTIVRQGGDFQAALPVGARKFATLRRAQFQGTGSGNLMVALNGEIRVSNEQVMALTSELGRAAEGQSVPGPLLPRPPAPPETLSR